MKKISCLATSITFAYKNSTGLVMVLTTVTAGFSTGQSHLLLLMLMHNLTASYNTFQI